MDPESFKPNEVVEKVDPRVFSRYVVDRLIATTSSTFLFECNCPLSQAMRPKPRTG